MYDPNQHNWQSFPPYGRNVATGADSNARGSYQIGSSIFQWMLRQGDTTLAGTSPVTTPPQPLSGYTPIPATIQAESYAGMSGVATAATNDAGGGLNVGWIDNGDWMDYTVNVATAGAYTVNFRLATPYNSVTMALRDETGKVLATMSTNSTGDFQKWVTLKTTVTLPAGLQTLRLISTTNQRWNINWMQFVAGTTSAAGQKVVSAQANAFGVDSAQGSGVAYFHVYPNPVRDRATLDISNAHVGKIKVQVVSTSGSLVQEYEYEKTSQTIQVPLNMGGLTAGIYIVRVYGADWSETRKIEKW